MRRFLVFAGDDYYPAGGWGDFVADSDEPPAFLVVKPTRIGWYAETSQLLLLGGQYFDWAHAIDTKEGTITHYRVSRITGELDADVEALDL